MEVTNVERILCEVPFTERQAKITEREVYSWNIIEFCKVTLNSGVHGWGETMLHYTTGGRVTDASVARVMGRPAAELMFDDTIGMGLQMALFDAVVSAAVSLISSAAYAAAQTLLPLPVLAAGSCCGALAVCLVPVNVPCATGQSQRRPRVCITGPTSPRLGPRLLVVHRRDPRRLGRGGGHGGGARLHHDEAETKAVV